MVSRLKPVSASLEVDSKLYRNEYFLIFIGDGDIASVHNGLHHH